jgi:hypothetical protein
VTSRLVVDADDGSRSNPGLAGYAQLGAGSAAADGLANEAMDSAAGE